MNSPHTVKALVLSGHGINCELETKEAFIFAGAKTDIIHLNAFLEPNFPLLDYDILAFPGGFSFGDDLGAGVVLAARLHKKKSEIKTFIEKGGYILGICNGFQVLVHMGLLPNTEKQEKTEVALIENPDKTFTNDWVKLKVNSRSQSPFFKNLHELDLPIRNQEGRLILKNEAIKNTVLEQGLDVLTYKKNPNQSDLNIAGLLDTTGHVLGMMPHPEAFLTKHNHPNWTAQSSKKKEWGDGYFIFKNIVEHVQALKENI